MALRIAAATALATAESRVDPAEVVNKPSPSGPANELHPARLVFAHGFHSNWGLGRPWWRIDWPSTDYLFIGGLRRYTVIDTASDSVHQSLNDESLCD